MISFSNVNTLKNKKITFIISKIVYQSEQNQFTSCLVNLEFLVIDFTCENLYGRQSFEYYYQ